MWPFFGGSGGKVVSRELRIELANQCGVPYPDSEKFLAVSQGGKTAGRKVTNFRVFAPTSVVAENKRGYNDLPDESIIYDGIIEGDGSITVNKGRKMR